MSPAELDVIGDEARHVREVIDASSSFSGLEGWSKLAFENFDYVLEVVANEDVNEEMRQCGVAPAST